ncbi:MAG: hypothetical protein ACKPKO_10405, partial [Candidatus Fonsibacter sp.]
MGDGVDQFVLCVRGDRRVAAVRARALDILGARDLDVCLMVDGRVVEGEGAELAAVAGGGAGLLVNRAGTGSEAAEIVALEPREWPQPFPVMVFQDPGDARLASQLTTFAGATK